MKKVGIADWLASRFLVLVLLVGGTVPALHAQVDTLQKARESVFLVGVVKAENDRFQSVGTAWTIARRFLATNAHVAEALLELKEPGDRIVARRGVFDRNEIVLGEPSIHPAYSVWNPRLQRMIRHDNWQMEGFEYQPVADVAVLPVLVGDPPPLQVLTEADYQPRPGQDVVYYMGYPMEGVSGFATLHTVPMHVSAVTDYFFQDADWHEGGLMHLAGQVSGGASGSPIIRKEDGAVVGILSSGDNLLGWTGGGPIDDANHWRRINIGFSYAQKVDLALELVNDTAQARQHERNLQWQKTLRNGIFAKSEDVIRMLVHQTARNRYSVPSHQIELVTRQRWLFRTDTPRRSVPITLTEGFAYWFAAHSDDGTWINGQVTAGARQLGLDDMHDNLPVIDVIARPGQTEVVFEVEAIEDIFGHSEIDVHIYRHAVGSEMQTAWETLTSWLDTADRDGERVHHQILTMQRSGMLTHTCQLAATPGARYLAYARSQRGRDIDLVARHGESEIASDRAEDHYPIIDFEAPGEVMEIDLIIPRASRKGEGIELTVWQIPQPIIPSLDNLFGGAPANFPGRPSRLSQTADPAASPSFGTVSLQAGFIQDPHIVGLLSGGAVPAREINGELRGFIAAVPDVTLHWHGSTENLRVFFNAEEGNQDTTLVIHTPDGRWIGNDDAFDGTLNPMLELSGYGEGRYAIWGGSYTFGEEIRGSLIITERSDLKPR